MLMYNYSELVHTHIQLWSSHLAK